MVLITYRFSPIFEFLPLFLFIYDVGIENCAAIFFKKMTIVRNSFDSFATEKIDMSFVILEDAHFLFNYWLHDYKHTS